MIRTKAWSVLMVLVILVSLFVPVGTARAWEQPTHTQINFEAGRVFLRTYASSGMEKYRLGPITQRGLDETYRGIAVESRSLLIDPWSVADVYFDPYEIGERSLTLGQWVFYGGDWADEPHLYASVRHFYDPWSLWGQPYLTDQYEFHGWYDDPQIDARTWALDHPDNPFSFESALFYYKAAMETPEEPLRSEPRLTSGHWKLNLNLTPRDAADQRSIHLAMAYRALGETMHMLGDMTQPAHVRNDAHAYSEPIEEAVKRLPLAGLQGVRVAAFDTRIAAEDMGSPILSFMVKLFGYAAEPIAKALTERGGELVVEPEGFYVEGREGPLKEGELERAEAWAALLRDAVS